MHKLLVVYPTPTDRSAFERHYRQTHLPLVGRLPGVRDMEFALNLDAEGGPVYAIFEATFPSAEALGAALASPEGRAVQEDVPNYATGGATVLTYAPESVPARNP
ncbi:MAG TPA: EthD family reductase [Microbacterium sp.]|uniref:EthD family reductase n=1 Tax=Microbacterium sp. TaxID=51671 RepID=UPI002B48258F|nr:EthD family reductase [Microbacterium sp.]HKT56951.1 EthD family reductase [Microbacterium sp.]